MVRRWYWSALVISLVINFIVFFGGNVDPFTSFSCTPPDCNDLSLFGWISQSWSTTADAVAFGLRINHDLAKAIRALSVVHVALACLLSYSWLVVDGSVQLTKIRSSLTIRSSVDVPGSNVSSKVTMFRVASRRTWTQQLFLYAALAVTPAFMLQMLYLFVSLAGLTVSPLFFALELFALAHKIEVFGIVIGSVVRNVSRCVCCVVCSGCASGTCTSLCFCVSQVGHGHRASVHRAVVLHADRNRVLFW
jgi:hypothetical protein